MKKNKESIDMNIDYYNEYFGEDLKAIEEELEKSKQYSEIIDNEIQKLSVPSLGQNRGGQHYLIEHINNAVQLQTQRQGLRKDRFAIKKAILDYAAKFAEERDSDEDSLIDKINELIEHDKNKTKTEEKPINDNSLDELIDNALEN